MIILLRVALASFVIADEIRNTLKPKMVESAHALAI
jgi:hypothetical protein